MLSTEQNAMLTQTDPSTPMGAFFRRFWQPVALVEELATPDGPPVKINIMGQELVAFRDTEGAVGVLDAHCPHRGAHLFFGRNEDCGLRCVYHGWKFDRHGKAMELPNVPADSNLHKTVRTKAYPVREFGEVIWAYLGPEPATLPGGILPELPQLEFACMPPSHRFVTKQRFDCNWAQIMEGDLDTAHFSFLHMPAPSVPSAYHPHSQADEKRLRWMRDDPMPHFEVLEHETGFVVAAARIADGQKYWRMTQYLMPSHGTGPSTLPGETYHGFTLAPIDDASCWCYAYSWNPVRPLGNEERSKLDGGWALICERDENYVPVRNIYNDFQIDREEQKHRTFTGVKGLAEQDSMIQHSQGRIMDRTRETLTGTDKAVVRFRTKILKGATDLLEGKEPEAPTKHDLFKARPGSWLASSDLSLEQVMVDRFGDPLGRVRDGSIATRTATPKHPPNTPDTKAGPLEAVLSKIDGWRRDSLRIGFTNGCFDILHPGHVSLLRQARATCDRLVVGLNSDASVRLLKGPSRPVQDEAARAAVLSAFADVDALVVFDEETPERLIEAVRPDVLVKGADYTVETVVGANFVRKHGGEVVLARLEEGHSTTKTIARMIAP